MERKNKKTNNLIRSNNNNSKFDNWFDWEINNNIEISKFKEVISGVDSSNFSPDFLSEILMDRLSKINTDKILDYGAGLGRNLPLLKKYSSEWITRENDPSFIGWTVFDANDLIIYTNYMKQIPELLGVNNFKYSILKEIGTSIFFNIFNNWIFHIFYNIQKTNIYFYYFTNIVNYIYKTTCFTTFN